MAGAAVLERLRSGLGLGPPIVWRTATVRELVTETARAKTLSLGIDDWPGHRAGQHVDVRLTAPDGYQAERSYSIASAPELDALELTVELVDEGEVSPWFTEEARPGDQLEVRGPIGGHFSWAVEDDSGPLLLVAGGSGLVPLMAMLRHRAARHSEIDARLLVSARSAEDALYTQELAGLEPAAGLRVEHTYTRTPPPGWTGWARRVDADMLARLGPGPEQRPRCFVCGPTPFVESVAEALVAAGNKDIRAERFGPTGEKT